MKALSPKKIRCQAWLPNSRWVEDSRQCANNSVDNARYCPQHGGASRDFVQRFIDWAGTTYSTKGIIIEGNKLQDFLELVRIARQITGEEP